MKIIKGTFEELANLLDICDRLAHLNEGTTLTTIQGTDEKFIDVEHIIRNAGGGLKEIQVILSEYEILEYTTEEMQNLNLIERD